MVATAHIAPSTKCSVVFARWRSYAYPYMVTWTHASLPSLKRHLDWFSRFCTARARIINTETQRDRHAEHVTSRYAQE